jgi:hypothetical protein
MKTSLKAADKPAFSEVNPYRTEVDMHLDSPVAEQIKEHVTPAAKKAAKKTAERTGSLIHSFSFDPHPTRTRIIMGTKVGTFAFIGGVFAAISWIRRKS